MPARIARSNVQATVSKSAARNKSRKRNLDAYSIASHQIPVEKSLRKSRLGEFLDDGPKPKRRRVAENGSDEEDEDDDMDEGEPVNPKRSAGVADGIEEGSDSEGNEWTLGGLREDDEDSDLDSDEAFGESDEERFAGFTFRGSSSSKVKQQRSQKERARSQARAETSGVDLNEENSASGDEGDDGFGDEGVDLATMLDDDDETSPMDEDMDSDQSEDEEDGESTSEEDEDGEEADDENDERIARMRDRVDALDAADRPAASESAPQQTTLTVEDLLADLDPAVRKQFAAPLKTRKTSEQPKTLSAPLPPRQQNKLNREVASKKAKEQLDRWRDTVIHNRRAEHLSFPLRDPDQGEPLGKERFVQGAPQNELEENIRRIMEESGIASKTEQGDDEEGMLVKSEELAEKTIPLEEVSRRRAELRKARELLFREEIKAKRIAKIKSKSYRRVHRRERNRELEKEGERELDDDEEEYADRKRAEARMSTKHKDSKWAKSLKATNRTVWDDDARSGVHEQARRNEELRKRIAGDEVDEDGGSDVPSDGGSDNSDEDEDGQTLKQLDRIQRDGQEEDKRGGLSGMKFMRAAEERRRQQNDEDVERLRKELAVEDGDEDESDEETINDQGLGRAVFGPKGKELPMPGKKIKRPELEEGDASEDEDELEIRLDEDGPLSSKSFHEGEDEVVLDVSNHDKPSEAADKAHAQAAPAKKKPVKSAKQHTNSSGAQSSNGMALVANTEKDAAASDNESESEQVNAILTGDQPSSYYQQIAFAGDDTKAAFDAEKAEAVISEDEKEVSSYLPGWGSWTGEGLSKSVRKAANRQRHNPLYKTKLAGVKAENRKDARLENVMISEKQDRKGKKYKADVLPHEYERKEQYERSMRIPMGPEWVTKETYQRNTRPRVVVKPGVVVGAMERPVL